MIALSAYTLREEGGGALEVGVRCKAAKGAALEAWGAPGHKDYGVGSLRGGTLGPRGGANAHPSPKRDTGALHGVGGGGGGGG